MGASHQGIHPVNPILLGDGSRTLTTMTLATAQLVADNKGNHPINKSFPNEDIFQKFWL
jgi:hypothetical protein